jgi:hypothetical protein
MARLTHRLNIPLEEEIKKWYQDQAKAMGARSAAEIARIALGQVANGTIEINFLPKEVSTNEANTRAG